MFSFVMFSVLRVDGKTCSLTLLILIFNLSHYREIRSGSLEWEAARAHLYPDSAWIEV